MRVIAGKYGSRRLAAPPGRKTRPTSDRLRETLFNVLAPQVEGSVFLDLYAGSGAVGIEALSRGAHEVIFVEQATQALKTIRANLSSLDIHGGFALESAVASAAAIVVRRLAAEGARVDLVFLDPPYDRGGEYELVLGLLGGECGSLLSEDAVVVAEHGRWRRLAASYGNLDRYRVLRQGDAALSFYRVK